MKISHIAIWAKDIEKMKEFYIKYFNCKCGDKYVNTKKGFESYFLEFEDNRCRLEIMKRNDINDLDKNKEYYVFAHIAISVGSKDKVDSLTNLFEKDGIKILSYPRVTGDGYYESVVFDIENNRVEITI
ncbi:VOC family protein [Brachyspira pilosicoli]|uniref:Glyoxalase/bleomycin resistance/extradiol dioxygenase family protein n=1 Tax=Brachyspira pilosicoli TaxID=52584 RepID=A0A5C8EPF6_BRAPL|nr:VOC family protein [Brachyspira pilosicoli]TXJ39686.1 glyoxalase/bleomycin resistance/extradiol dioxygenase family protein [Brachyspira pilosicoli]